MVDRPEFGHHIIAVFHDVREDPCCSKLITGRVEQPSLGEDGIVAIPADKAVLVREARETIVGGVGTKQEAVFCPRGEHAIRLVKRLGREVIGHDADIGLISAEHHERPAEHGVGRVESGQDALTSGFLVPGRAIDLPSEEQIAYAPGFHRRAELARIDRVILDSVAKARDARVPKRGNGAQHGVLHIEWKARAHALDIKLGGAPTLRLQEDGVRAFVRETSHLILD